MALLTMSVCNSATGRSAGLLSGDTLKSTYMSHLGSQGQREAIPMKGDPVPQEARDPRVDVLVSAQGFEPWTY